MTASKIIQYIHRPTLTELGMGNTNDRYLVVDSSKDLSQIFPLGDDVTLIDTTTNKEYKVYSKVENKEFRIKRFGDIVDDYHMEPGDEIVITHYESSDNIFNMLTVNECGRVLLNPGRRENGKIIDFEIMNIQRLPGFTEDNNYSFACEYKGSTKDIVISFSEYRKKRSDSPVETKFFSVQFDQHYLDYDSKNYYYLTIRNNVVVLRNLPKSDYRILLEDEGTNNEANELNKQYHRNISNGVTGQEYIQSYITALRTKPFLLLAGISGTGKSRIVRKLAQATTTQHYKNEEDRWKDNRPENFELIQVKPNWHNSMDVVGFFSNISKRYEFTPFVTFVAKAWQHKDTPYFLCLDEMNLAPVEEYFAEFLSAIESRSTDENGDYITDPIIKPFKYYDSDNEDVKVSDQMIAKLIGSLDTEEKRKLAEHFRNKGLTLPPNLMVMGTVNMDETTFSFSRKVLDRAMSVEMNEVDFDKFLSGESEQFPLLTDINELLVKRPLQASEVKKGIDSRMVIDYLKTINDLLDGTPFKLGYRAANEAMLYVAASRVFADEGFSTNKALDEYTLMKILSRIEGDDNRLAVDEDDQVVSSIGREKITDAGEDRINLLNCMRAIVRDYIGTETLTEKKINTMYRTLEREHFVSYWA